MIVILIFGEAGGGRGGGENRVDDCEKRLVCSGRGAGARGWGEREREGTGVCRWLVRGW